MDAQKWLMLTVIRQFCGQRSMNGVIYLLHGRRSSQVIQDASLFYVLPLTACLKHRYKEELYSVKNELKKEEAYIEDEKGRVSLTDYGSDLLEKANSQFVLPVHFNGGKYELNGEADWFWKRLSLFIQSLSVRLKSSTPFIPVQYDSKVQHWVKGYFPEKDQRKNVADGLYKELYTLLENMEDEVALIFVRRLTSWKRTGETISQLTAENKDPVMTYLSFRSVIHYLMDQVTQKKEAYPHLSLFLKETRKTSLVTNTAEETYRLLKQGYSMDRIASKRNLKKSTIEDHIIEIILFTPGVHAGQFVDPAIVEQVLNVAEELNTQRLKKIKDALGEGYDYFTIRASLASRHERMSQR
ncbi:helix-turn-helix domain-containing protein [Alteribacter keqinensis]|uniref:Helicase Helix-turn-helix domain-containing protein n=1 Tax=Alteribacter keqinensis TaxID=2483800 RepID=A0A3M7TXF5_9BACI|nr:helix-turn-helix domain-containing protein [Alteribacter keqinensis]RNA69105.1 hypothetical protein EBO34_03895 [Alteribacter keqinensis]